jgi:hypothetical protein
MLLFRNRDSSNSVFLMHEDTGSLEQYRFDLPDSEDVELAPGQNIWLYYDPNRSRWTAAITAQAAGGITSGVVNSGLVGGGGEVYFASVSLTSQQLDDLNATPVQIVAAPGAGKVIVPLGIEYIVNKANNTTWTAGPNFQLIHAGQTTSLATGGISGLSSSSSGYVIGASPQTTWTYAVGTDVTNAALQVRFSSNTTPNPGPPAGSATARVSCAYIIIDAP